MKAQEEIGLDIGVLRGSDDLEMYLPGEPGYDAGRAAWNAAVEHRPLAVAVPLNAVGVQQVVKFARRAGVSVAIQSTGHGPTRAARDAILINMWKMSEVRIDPELGRAHIGGGAKWQAVLDVCVGYGLAPLLGSTPDVSAVGYTLGGGLGWMARKYGTSADSVHSFEVVTADGELIRTSPTQDPELFWALRGAGAGHLGVVTEMEAQLYPISELYAGNLFYPARLATEVIKRWRDWIPTVPEDLTSAVTMLNFPPVEEVPEELRGASFILVRGAYDGPADDGERLLSYWREWEEPAIDMFGPLPFADVAEISQDPLDPVPNEGTGLWLHSLDDATIEALVEAAFPGQSPPLLVQVEMRHAGGALRRGSEIESAFGNRDANILLELVGVTETPEEIAAVRNLIEKTRVRIASSLTGGHYLNYAEGDERRFGVERGIGSEAARRLAAVKRRLDPDDLFDHGLAAILRQGGAGGSSSGAPPTPSSSADPPSSGRLAEKNQPALFG